MFAPHIRGRRRSLDQQKKVELCDLVHHGATVEEAADTIGVSLRTVQREAKLDEDFDHELKLALGGAPDPLKLMQRAARAHWRAAAWLLERTDPEHYGRRPKSSASPEQFEGALRFMLEAALEATPPEARATVYQRLQAAREQAFKGVFPNYGPWGRPKNPKLPPTPLANQEHRNHVLDPSSGYHVYDKIADPSEQEEQRTLWEASPTPMTPVTPGDNEPHPPSMPSFESSESCAPADSTPQPLSAPAGRRHLARGASPWIERQRKSKPQRGEVAQALRNPRSNTPRRPNVSRSNHRILSPKTRFATKLNAAHLNAATAPQNALVSREAVAVFDPEAQARRERVPKPELHVNLSVVPASPPAS